MSIEVSFEVTIICDECGKELKAEMDRKGTMIVIPCETCMDKSYSQGEIEGKRIAQ